MRLTSSGKRIGPHIYYHVEVIASLERRERAQVETAFEIAQVIPRERINVIKLSQLTESVTLLEYAHFFDDAFPVLANSWTVDLANRAFRYRTYAESLNPPLLHRKELLLRQDHPQNELFRALTVTAEQIGLFDDPNRIGFKKAWETLLAQRGYKVVGHDLLPVGNDETSIGEATIPSLDGIARHLTALTRYGFSAPMQALARFGFLNGTKTVFDYGCGRGDDLRGLRENNIEANGWDPHYSPDNEKRKAHLVNLGFVCRRATKTDHLNGVMRVQN